MPFDLSTLLGVEFLAMATLEAKRNEETDPVKRCYPGGAFDPMGMSKGDLKTLQLKEIKNGGCTHSPCGRRKRRDVRSAAAWPVHSHTVGLCPPPPGTSSTAHFFQRSRVLTGVDAGCSRRVSVWGAGISRRVETSPEASSLNAINSSEEGC